MGTCLQLLVYDQDTVHRGYASIKTSKNPKKK